MNQQKKTRGRSSAAGSSGSPARDGDGGLRFTVWTAVYGAAGIVTAGLGFFLLSREEISVAPFLLLLAFLVLFPLALLK